MNILVGWSTLGGVEEDVDEDDVAADTLLLRSLELQQAKDRNLKLENHVFLLLLLFVNGEVYFT